MLSDQKLNHIWRPFSSHAYAANALYIPKFGDSKAYELMVGLTQNYPVWANHPLLDYWQGYHRFGAERFEHEWQKMKVLGWEIRLDKNYWSFLYLPDGKACRIFVRFLSGIKGRLKINILIDNDSDVQRELELRLFFSPIWTLAFPKHKINNITQSTVRLYQDDFDFEFKTKQLKFKNIEVISSLNYIWFPNNIELSSNPENPISKEKMRLMIETKPFIIGPHEKKELEINVFPTKDAKNEKLGKWPKLVMPDSKNLAYEHLWWEIQHNQQYAKPKNQTRAMLTSILIPARQFGKYYLWDSGMTMLGASEKDTTFVEDHLSKLPNPQLLGSDAYTVVGSFIPTPIFAWWELYSKNRDKTLLQKYYDKLKQLSDAFYFWPESMYSAEHDGLISTPRNTNGMDDHPAIIWCEGQVWTWDYDKPLPTNPDRVRRIGKQPGMTAVAVRLAKILRLAAYQLAKKDDIQYFSKLIQKSENALNERCWNEKLGMYLWLTRDDGQLPMYGIDSCYPLMSNSVSQIQRSRILEKLFSRDDGFWTKYGMTTIPPRSEYFRHGYWNGSIWMAAQWFIWKALINNGEMKFANALADKLMHLWERNHNKTLCCWEAFPLPDGEGKSNSRFTGLTSTMLSFSHARRSPGRVQFSQDVLAKVNIDKKFTNLSAKLISPFDKVKSGFSAVLKPNALYEIFIDKNLKFKKHTDTYGYLDFAMTIPLNKIVTVYITKSSQKD
ncbi:MAG: hypothetical protein A2Y10_01245 [Planctomycetes bacterium GWF2_41_51]|nr:MAG: hypothetical protein A2Y10_01245 [Planctomycetes bacterium GWF2_41_51]HBG25628.1 hypothetical protein [Phycisphaerales bacterium]